MSTWTEISAGELHAAEQRIRVALGDDASEVVSKINNDQSFAETLASYIKGAMIGENRLLTSLNPQWLRAREIMGKNFFGVEEAIEHFGVNPTRQQLAVLSEVPFSEAVLEETKNTHVLVAVFPLSILEIRGKVDSGLFYDQSWYNKELFAKEHGEVCWQLVRKTPVDGSISKNWSEQQALITEDDEVPSARVMTYIIIGHYLATGERLFEHVYVRTSSVDSDGSRVSVGSFELTGLDVNDYWDDYRYDGLGVASSRKF